MTLAEQAATPLGRVRDPRAPGGERPLRVVQLWAHAGIQGGGGGVAMNRLHRGLLAHGVHSTLLEEAGEDVDASEGRYAVPRWRVLDGGLRRVASRVGLNDVHRLSTLALLRHPLVREADVLHVNGTHSGFLNYLALPLLTRGRPALFTLHDMWAVTGHCAYSLECERWRTGCGGCPHLDMLPATRRDATAIEWRLKRHAYRRSRIAFTAPSRWLTDIARDGLPGFEVEQIPYGVDTRLYAPTPTAEARSALGIPADRHVLLFVSVNLADWRKGGDLIPAILGALPPEVRDNTVTVLLGPHNEALAERLDVPVIALGPIYDEARKALAYAAADLLILPTRADNDPLVLSEAMACGTPAASFRVGGVPETVRHGISGVTAEAEDAAALGREIGALLEEPGRLQEMGRRARRQVEDERNLDAWVGRHLALYRRLIAAPA